MKGSSRLLWLGFLLCILSFRVLAQSPLASRYNRQTVRQPGAPSLQDSSGIDSLNAMARNFYGVNSDSTFYYSRKALDLSRQAGWKFGEAESWRRLGNAYEMIGDYTNMLTSYQHSLQIAEKINDPRLIARAHTNISLFYKDMGEYDAAMQQMELASRSYQRGGDSMQLSYVLSDQYEMSYRRGQYPAARQYAQQALDIVLALRDSAAIAGCRNDMGQVLEALGDYAGSLHYLLPSMAWYIRRNDKLGEATTGVLLARTRLSLGQYQEAIRAGSRSLELAQETGRRKEIRDAGKVLADIYETRKDYPRALQYYKLYKDFSDSLFNETTRKQTFALENRYEYERRELLMREEAARRDAVQQETARNHFHQISVAVLLILFLAALVITLFHRAMDKHRTNLLLQNRSREIHRQKEEIEHQAVQLLLNNQQKDKLFSIVSHDLKGPLNSLKSVLDFLKENSLTEAEINMMMAELRMNVDYSAELVNNLLHWAGSQLDGIHAHPVPLHLSQLTSETMTLFMKQASDKKILLNNAIPPALTGLADKDMVQVVIRNLLSNAIKFCRAGDSITISGEMDGAAIGITVKDTGTGIQPDILEKINRHESVTTYGTAREKGTGLGLLLCREFTEANKGKFRIDSRPGEGTAIYFTIPAEPSSSSIMV